nr:tail fiber domain-containing protein [Halomonas elongata]
MKDSVYSLGNASRRWSEIYSENGVIKTSDEREKQKIRDISTAEKKIAHELKKHIHAFKWEDAIEEKGSQARWHFGIMAQTVKDLFSKHGLDATQYGLFCYDEWKEQPEIRDHETGNIVQEHLPSGSRYGIRYDQLLAFIIAAI